MAKGRLRYEFAELARRRSSGGLAVLADDPSTLALGQAAPDTFALAGRKRVLETRLANRARCADGLGFLRVVIRHGVEDVWVDSSTCGSLAPTGVHPGSLSFSGRSFRRTGRDKIDLQGVRPAVTLIPHARGFAVRNLDYE